MQLRPYQAEAVAAVYRHLRGRDDNPVVVVPTAGGKTPILATVCRDAVNVWKGRVLVVSHVKELLEQAVDKLRLVCPELPVGVYSAGLGRRDISQRVIVAGIQSVYKRAQELGAFDLIVVDEAHLIPADGEGMYRQFLSDAKRLSPHLRVIGLTATPFRLGSGSICAPDHFLNAICYEVGIKELIRDGYLCPLVSKAGVSTVNTSALPVRGGDFVADAVETLMDADGLVNAACAEIVERTKDRQACLIFASGVCHGEHVARVLHEQFGAECGFVCGNTPAPLREELLARFRGECSPGLFGHAPLKYLCNVNVLTTGFDVPHIDCVALLRPTMSAGLYYQMVGRGFRLHPNKSNCLVLDFGGNLVRHGPVDQVQPKHRNGAGCGPAPAKECPECHSVIAAGYANCPDCGHAFPPPERPAHEPKASEAGVLSGQVTLTTHRVSDVYYSIHTKRDAREGNPRTMRVDYKVGWHDYQSEWICLEHAGYARQKAAAWWKRRSPDPVPGTIERAVELAQAGALARPMAITVRSVAGEPYERIIGYELGPLPEPLPAEALETFEELTHDDIPF
ncbi:MAG: DEAD/DEAH box helicase family protein [Planctomycetes bacterium]|nr:DEAD/DEAH box helicase family protein [Planctomycetota bacterium]